LANIINGTDTGSGGLITTGDSSDELQIQTAETTAITITSGQQSVFIAGTAAAPAVTTTGDLNTGIFFSAADTLVVTTGGTAAVTVDSGQRTKFPTTIGVGGATPSASGSGISFPATQSASSDANTLDDYEEGTWTGTLTGTVSNPSTAVTATGKYTKIGNTVAVQVFFENKNTSGASGEARVSGLPFSISDNTAGAVMTEQMLTFTGTTLVAFFVTSETTVRFYVSGSNASWDVATHNAGSGRFLIFGGSYFI
jgi:hypothetical protein